MTEEPKERSMHKAFLQIFQAPLRLSNAVTAIIFAGITAACVGAFHDGSSSSLDFPLLMLIVMLRGSEQRIDQLEKELDKLTGRAPQNEIVQHEPTHSTSSISPTRK